jgi:hypothetical protein
LPFVEGDHKDRGDGGEFGRGPKSASRPEKCMCAVRRRKARAAPSKAPKA